MDGITPVSSLSGFAAYLAQSNLLTKQVAMDALTRATQAHVPYVEYLVKHKHIKESVLARATAQYFALPLIDITAVETDKIPQTFLQMQPVKKRQAMPLFKRSGFLYIAVADPTIESLNEVRFYTGSDIRLVICEQSMLAQKIDEIQNQYIVTEMSKKGDKGSRKTEDLLPLEESAELAAYDVESAPVVNYVNKIINDAIEKGASDIHFERYENQYRIRYRIHGLLYPVASPPIKLANYLLARIKIMSNLDITEHRIPQDGRFKYTLVKDLPIDFRVSVCPTLYGEKIVLRLLDPTQLVHRLDQLGMDPKQQADFHDALAHHQGIILVTGPTGSGKTVTLYSALNYLNSTEDNIMTVEDPVEIPMPGINQVHVNPKVGLSFANVLRAFLRQDPDIIMVGEIRDLETADISIKAAQTGHLVLSTIHTNSCPDTLNRLVYMGVAAYNVASSLILVVAQRLLRVLCPLCKEKESLPADVLLKEGFKKEEIDSLQLYKPKGCDHCIFGYKGRTGIFEVMPISPEMTYLIIRGASNLEIAKQAKSEGITDLREAGLNKVRQGITSLAELNRTVR